MAKKEQITITLDEDILTRLRQIAENKSQSLSSVIEYNIKTSKLSKDNDEAGKILEILAELKNDITKK